MIIESFWELPQSAVGLRVSEAILQHWRKGVYSYLDRPRPGYGLMLMVKGTIRFVSDADALSAATGDLVFLPKASRYEARFGDDTEDYLINFDLPGVDTTVSEPTRIFGGAPLDVYRRYSELIGEGRHRGVDSLKSKALFLLLLDEIVKSSIGLSQNDRAAVERAKQLLDAEHCDSVEEIARACGISASGLRQKFKASEGVSPIEYRMKQRISHAAYLLETTELSVAEIAERLGFYDAPYFCRCFKGMLGVTPKEYLRSRQL